MMKKHSKGQYVLKKFMEKHLYPDMVEKDRKMRECFILLQAEMAVAHKCLDGLITRFDGERILALFERIEFLKRKLHLSGEINELSIQDVSKELN